MPLCNTLCFQYSTIENEKKQFNTVRVASSQYTHALSYFTGGSGFLKTQITMSDTSDRPNKGGVSVKYDSYSRYLNKRKIRESVRRTTTTTTVPPRSTNNNKQQKYGVGILSEKCRCQFTL